MTDSPSVRLLEAAAADDAALVRRLTVLINDVYATDESGLWRDGTTRTTPPELAELIRAGEITVATTRDGDIVGAMHLYDVSDDTSGFGMLVSAPERRGIGIGRALLDFAERQSSRRGLRAMRLELLVPREWAHPRKEFVKAWYGRRGYRLVFTGTLGDAYPHLADLLATPCDFEVHEKPLASAAA